MRLAIPVSGSPRADQRQGGTCRPLESDIYRSRAQLTRSNGRISQQAGRSFQLPASLRITNDKLPWAFLTRTRCDGTSRLQGIEDFCSSLHIQ
uniref:Uncharacterized protein n=1 Tax=Bionectria ochroleuca TaxID=29856 RepID=A0A0B7JSG5_BIOOC